MKANRVFYLTTVLSAGLLVVTILAACADGPRPLLGPGVFLGVVFGFAVLGLCTAGEAGIPRFTLSVAISTFSIPVLITASLLKTSPPDETSGRSIVVVINGEVIDLDEGWFFANPFNASVFWQTVDTRDVFEATLKAKTEDGITVAAQVEMPFEMELDSKQLVAIMTRGEVVDEVVREKIRDHLQNCFEKAVAQVEYSELHNRMPVKWLMAQGVDLDVLNGFKVRPTEALYIEEFSVWIANETTQLGGRFLLGGFSFYDSAEKVF